MIGGLRGLSSAGRAPALQAGGRRFDPDSLHSLAAWVGYRFSLIGVVKVGSRGDREV